MRVLSDGGLRRRGGATLFTKVGPRLRRGLLLAMVGAFNATRHLDALYASCNNHNPSKTKDLETTDALLQQTKKRKT